jgi:hypothetical protein
VQTNEGFRQCRSFGVTRIGKIGCHLPMKPSRTSCRMTLKTRWRSPGPVCNFVPPNHPLLINNLADRISFREFDSGRAEFGCGLHHRHDFKCSTGAAGFYPIPSGGPTRSSGCRVPDHALNLRARPSNPSRRGDHQSRRRPQGMAAQTRSCR